MKVKSKIWKTDINIFKTLHRKNSFICYSNLDLAKIR